MTRNKIPLASQSAQGFMVGNDTPDRMHTRAGIRQEEARWERCRTCGLSRSEGQQAASYRPRFIGAGMTMDERP